MKPDPTLLAGAAISGQLHTGASIERSSVQPAGLVTTTIISSVIGIFCTVRKPPPPVTVPLVEIIVLSASVLIRTE